MGYLRGMLSMWDRELVLKVLEKNIVKCVYDTAYFLTMHYIILEVISKYDSVRTDLTMRHTTESGKSNYGITYRKDNTVDFVKYLPNQNWVTYTAIWKHSKARLFPKYRSYIICLILITKATHFKVIGESAVLYILGQCTHILHA